MSKVLRFTMQGWPESYDSTTFKSYHNKKFELSVEDGCLLWGTRVIIPPPGRSKILTELHEAHPGVSRMKAFARSYVWWPTLDEDIESEVKNCNQCRLHHTTPAAAPLHPWEWPGHPWTRLHIDYAGPFKGEMFLVVVDAYSKWLEVHQMTSTTSTATIEKLREILATHGLPTTVVSDNGTNFTSSEFEEFMKQNGIKHIKVSPYHPASNGQAERAVRIFKEGIEKMKEGSMRTKLSRFLLKYRITPHTTTGVPPAELLMGRHLRTQLDMIQPNLGDRSHRSLLGKLTGSGNLQRRINVVHTALSPVKFAFLMEFIHEETRSLAKETGHIRTKLIQGDFFTNFRKKGNEDDDSEQLMISLRTLIQWFSTRIINVQFSKCEMYGMDTLYSDMLRHSMRKTSFLKVLPLSDHERSVLFANITQRWKIRQLYQIFPMMYETNLDSNAANQSCSGIQAN
ncbi:Uncharacterized protein K02A2.6 [Paramuricea clavata]|uniref:Uncharacterized protein K02A2.6 n=1 Tax=Paramuricea clavata TaxID=317549 RepID=A0A7D9E047_PARCT|nr:Uncharacterized protein K02A2.6 [Paramuricea clavata]